MLEGGGWGLSDNKGKEAIFGGIEQERWARKEIQIRKSILLHIIQFNHLNISKHLYISVIWLVVRPLRLDWIEIIIRF